MAAIFTQGEPATTHAAPEQKSQLCSYVQDLLKLKSWDRSDVGAHVPAVTLLYPPRTKADLATGPGSSEYNKVLKRAKQLQRELGVRGLPCGTFLNLLHGKAH